MNSIFSIDVYRKKNTWYFDDNERGIKKEAFVCGASELITSLLGKKAKTGTLLFSESFIPNSDRLLVLEEYGYPQIRNGFTSYKGKTVPKYEDDKSAEPTSGWYQTDKGEKCWLCPAQLAFFGKVALTIYVKVIN